VKPTVNLGGDPLDVIRDDCEDIANRLGRDAARFAGKTVLITGAAGMLPAYLVDVLVHLNDTRRLERPVEVLAVMRSPDSNENRLKHLRGRQDVQFILADASRPFEVEEKVHFYVHAASPASPAAYRADPVGTLDVNSAGTKHVLDLATRDRAESVLFFSTSEVYGSPDAKHIPTPETYVGATQWLGGRACYVEGKRFGEALCAAAWEQHETPVKIVRPFHVQGPGLRLSDGRIVAELIRMGIEGEPFALKSDGTATRTYGYVSDAAFAFLKVLLSAENGQAFNVGADTPETSMLQLATIVSQIFGRTETVRVNTDARAAQLAGAPDRVRPDLGKLRERLGVVPTVALETGLERTIHWHRARIALPAK
jgi:UDP-glucuronate decarboxylase